MIQIIQNLDLFEKNLHIKLTISEKSLTPFWRKLLDVKQIMTLRVFIIRLPYFIIPKTKTKTKTKTKKTVV